MSSRLSRRVGRHPHWLLHLWKLIVGVVGWHSSKTRLALDRRVASHTLQRLLDHAHIHILLMGGSNVLLLLLKEFDLLLKSKLFHHEWGELGGTATMGDMQSAPCRARHASGARLCHCWMSFSAIVVS